MQLHGSVTRGDIVWVRVQFPHQWWPALVLGSDTLGVLVSFFNHNSISPRYFVESEVVSFEESFRWLMGHQNNKYRCETFYALLDSALRLLGQRVISSLRCRCQMPQSVRYGNGGRRGTLDGSSSTLQPIWLFGFVLKVAVLPWVDAPDFVDAIRAVAQVQAFRGYCSTMQKRIYKETPKRGNNVKLHPCSSLGEKMHSVTQESVALVLKDEYQIISKQVEKNLAIGVIRRLNSTIPVSEGKSEPLFKNQLLIIPGTNTNYSSMSYIKMLEPEESIQKDNQGCISFCETTMNFTDEVQKVDMKKSLDLTLQQSVTRESSSNLVHGTHSSNCEVDASTATFEGIIGSDSSVYQKRLQTSSDGDTRPLKSKKSARMKVSSGDCLVENKDLYQCVASCSIFNSKVGERSKTHAPFASSISLHMKFPKNFNLPSKGELIKKFSVFGSVDSSRTRAFLYTGSAQVAFFQEADAVAAYLYAKRKKVCFGEANVQFWLDPFEHKRRGSKCFALMYPSASKTAGPPLRSCLKKSNSLRRENRKKHYKVRFTIET